ncbi:MAG: carbohydrate kinase family protein [Theionarchaea archaeon]|nr:carbohydrate kinase family protein [Theionarchaea archaeon]
MDVICIGNLNFDISFHVSRLPGLHEKVRCDDATFSCGGSAGNTACWLASLGVKTGMGGAVGSDVLGQAQVKDLKKYNVDITHVSQINQSGVAVILVEGEAKRMIKYTGANAYKDVGDYLLDCSHVHLSSNDKDTVKKVIDIHKRKREITLSWDPQELLFEEFLPYFNYVFINEDDFRRKTGKKDLTRAADTLDTKTLVVTKNGGGCIIFGDTVRDIPSFSIEAADSTGAGDAFDAGFIFGLLKMLDISECGILGTACASLKVQHHGARGGICTRDTLEAFLQQRNIFMKLKPR